MNEPSDPVLQELLEATRRFNRVQLMRRNLPGDAELRPNEWHLLGHLRRADQGQGVKPSELAATLAVTPGNISQLITGLEKRGWLNRHIDPHDRRVVRITLTETGLNRLDTMRAAYAESYAGLVSAMGPDDSRQLARLLTQASAYFETAAISSAISRREAPQ